MRAFLAIELPDETRHVLTAVQEQMVGAEDDVKWVDESNIHLTLRFLGEISEEQRRAVEQAVTVTVGRAKSVEIGLAGLGAFPTPSSPRVIWVGIEQGREELTRLVVGIEERLTSAGLPQETRPFSAHITIGRVRSPRGAMRVARGLKDVTWTAPAPFHAAHVTLFTSDLSPAGPVYTVLARVPFGA